MSITNEEVKNIVISNENHFKIDNTGNVGIGTTGPTEKLEIDGSIKLNGNIDFEGFNQKIGYLDDWGMKLGYDGGAGYFTDMKFYGLNSNNRQFRIIDSENDTARLVVNGVGHVGIGTSNPITTLEIIGPSGGGTDSNHLASVNAPLYARGVNGFKESDGCEFRHTNGTQGIGIAYSGIYATGYNTNQSLYISSRGSGLIYGRTAWNVESDRRIKTDISLVNDDTALNQIQNLECYEYNYIEPDKKKPMKTIGFIAQDVFNIIPNAVSISTGYIPNEIQLISNPQWDENVLKIPDLDLSGSFTGKCKFYVSNDPSGEKGIFKELDVELDGKSFKFDQKWNHVKFHGKEVNDFHHLDKSQIFALHHSAIQELSRRNDAKDKRITELEDEIKKIKEHIGMG
tara:strand:+ start:211 stop:1407 length:1197 start_codon:yes stop_codon:yes gene_type:complete